jgi:hypothetical protein
MNMKYNYTIDKINSYLTRVSFVLFIIITVSILIAKGFTLVTIEKIMERFND